MYFEVLGFWGLLCLATFYFAEMRKENATIGIIGGVMLILLGVWLLGDTVLIQTGSTALSSQNITANVSGNITETTKSVSEAVTYTYSPVSVGFFSFNQLLGLVFVLSGLWAGYRYAFAIAK